MILRPCANTENYKQRKQLESRLKGLRIGHRSMHMSLNFFFFINLPWKCHFAPTLTVYPPLPISPRNVLWCSDNLCTPEYVRSIKGPSSVVWSIIRRNVHLHYFFSQIKPTASFLILKIFVGRFPLHKQASVLSIYRLHARRNFLQHSLPTLPLFIEENSTKV